MPRSYSRDFKNMITHFIVVDKHSTLKTAQQFDIPLKTL